jgi:hypothetical protein
MMVVLILVHLFVFSVVIRVFIMMVFPMLLRGRALPGHREADVVLEGRRPTRHGVLRLLIMIIS